MTHRYIDHAAQQGDPTILCHFCGREIEVVATAYELKIDDANRYRWRHTQTGDRHCELPPPTAQPHDFDESLRRLMRAQNRARAEAVTPKAAVAAGAGSEWGDR